MSTASAPSTVDTLIPPLPRGRGMRIAASRIRYELRLYFRRGDAVFFTFLFPVVMLTIFSVAFSAQGDFGARPDGTGGVSIARYYLPGMMAAGLLLSGLQNLGVDIAGERSDGTLKRLGGTPLSAYEYFVGKFGQVLITGLLQAALLLVVARVAFGVELPTDAGRWLTFAWVFVLGMATSAVLGIAISALPRSGRSATAVIVPFVLILQFVSGVYLRFADLPDWLQNVAAIFPLKWMAQGMRSVFLPDRFAAEEPGGVWDLGRLAIVLGVWLVVGLVLSRLTFRWIHRDR